MMSDQKWAIQAKANGYPLCDDCREPLTKEHWGDRRCQSCELGARRVQERRHDDEQLVRWRRQYGVD